MDLFLAIWKNHKETTSIATSRYRYKVALRINTDCGVLTLKHSRSTFIESLRKYLIDIYPADVTIDIASTYTCNPLVFNYNVWSHLPKIYLFKTLSQTILNKRPLFTVNDYTFIPEENEGLIILRQVPTNAAYLDNKRVPVMTNKAIWRRSVARKDCTSFYSIVTNRYLTKINFIEETPIAHVTDICTVASNASVQTSKYLMLL